MKCNLGNWDRLARLIFGTLLTTWAFMGGPWWTFAGLYLIASGSWRFCPIYASLGLGTNQDLGRSTNAEEESP